MLKIGINKCDNEDYHKDRKFKSSSTLKLFLKDPKEYYKRYVVGEEREEMYKSAYDFGSYMHSILLEPDKTEMNLLCLKELQGEVKLMKSLNPITKVKQLLQRLRRNKLSTFITSIMNTWTLKD